MLHLKSGRHMTLSTSSLLEPIKFGSDASVSVTIMAYQLTVTSPQQLRDFLTVGYFRGGEGNPPDAHS